MFLKEGLSNSSRISLPHQPKEKSCGSLLKAEVLDSDAGCSQEDPLLSEVSKETLRRSLSMERPRLSKSLVSNAVKIVQGLWNLEQLCLLPLFTFGRYRTFWPLPGFTGKITCGAAMPCFLGKTPFKQHCIHKKLARRLELPAYLQVSSRP